jgi:hypothetical protein
MIDSFNEFIAVCPQLLGRDNGASGGVHDALKRLWYNRSSLLSLDAKKFLETVSSNKRN